jgi:hypothetical protein
MERIANTRYQLVTQRGHAAETLDEFALAAVLAKLAEAVLPGAPRPTKESIAAALEAAERLARAQVESEICACGHHADDHLGWIGCLECDCRERRPDATEAPWVPRVQPTAAEVAQAFDDAYTHIPGGAA